jgi:phosphohistidine phosphatase
MDLYLLRHAIAVDRDSLWTGRDADRLLTKKGAKEMRRIARAMKDQGWSFDLILSSPFLRARETADIVADVFRQYERLMVSPHLKPGGSPEALVKEITGKYGNLKSVLLVGHEPYLSSLIATLVSGRNGVSLTMKKGGLCKVSTDSLRYGRCATLKWLLGPSQLLGGE